MRLQCTWGPLFRNIQMSLHDLHEGLSSGNELTRLTWGPLFGKWTHKTFMMASLQEMNSRDLHEDLSSGISKWTRTTYMRASLQEMSLHDLHEGLFLHPVQQSSTQQLLSRWYSTLDLARRNKRTGYDRLSWFEPSPLSMFSLLKRSANSYFFSCIRKNIIVI